MTAPKIFGIGLNKTATKSVSAAVQMLGFGSIHFEGAHTSAAIERAISEGEWMFSYCSRRFRRASAYFDIRAIEHHFDVADREFPGSRFILTTRELGTWLKSRESHVLQNQRLAGEGRFAGKWLTVDTEAWEMLWEHHHERVRSYFASRPDDLLELDVPAGDGWEKLAPFLGCEIPEEPFPYVTRRGPGRSSRKRSSLRRAGSQLKKRFAQDPRRAIATDSRTQPRSR